MKSEMAPPSTIRVHFDLELPQDMAGLTLPAGVNRRLQALLDKQDRGEPLTQDELLEAEGLVNLADLLSLIRLRASQHEPTTPTR
jgi:hypothetical protein